MQNGWEIPAEKNYPSWRPVSAPENRKSCRGIINIRAFLPKFLKYVNNYRIVTAFLREQTKVDLFFALSPGHGCSLPSFSQLPGNQVAAGAVKSRAGNIHHGIHDFIHPVIVQISHDHIADLAGDFRGSPF